ncbi:MAG TPA: hypothetical protein VGS41_14050 [Chthonomonadales bacterium]|nr:hypothetical protein [Chthonomonadales bacterium]
MDYQVVQPPQSASYSGPTVNWSAPMQAFTGQRQSQPGQQGQQGQSGQLTAQYAQLLQRLMGGQQQPGQPMNIQSPIAMSSGMNPGTIGGTNPALFGSPIY